MRRYEREIHDPEVLAVILDTFDTVYLGLHDDPYPYIVPLSFGYRIEDGKLYVYVHSALEGHKLDLLERNPNVSIAFSTFNYYKSIVYRTHRYDYRSVLAYGKIRYIDREAEPQTYSIAVPTLVKHMRPDSTKFDAKRLVFIKFYEICCDLEMVYGKSQVPVRTVKDVPMLDVPNLELDTTPYDITDLFAKRYNTVWPLSNRSEFTPDEQAAFNVKANEFKQDSSINSNRLVIRLNADVIKPANDPALDLFIFLADENNHVKDRWSVVFYNNKIDESKAVKYDPETGNVLIALNELPDYAKRIIIISSVYEAKELQHDLSMFQNISVELLDPDAKKGLAKYDVKDIAPEAVAITIGELVLGEGRWKFSPINRVESESRPSLLTEAYGLERGWVR